MSVAQRTRALRRSEVGIGSARPHERFTAQHRVIGQAAAWATFVLLVAYAITTALGFLFMFVSGVLSLVGLIGLPLDNMQYRNIGIVFGRAKTVEDIPMPSISA